jgi:hypothetical protein
MGGCSPKTIKSHFDKILLPQKKTKKMVVAATKFQHLKKKSGEFIF